MARVKRGTTTKRRHKKIIALAKGYKWLRKSVFKLAKQAVIKAGTNAYRDRRLKKRDFRRLWIQRISAALTTKDMKYSRFIYSLQNAHVRLNRKMLSELAVNDPDVFQAIVAKVK
ncbi:50S ribosomal protein L20 [Candidatus Peregrinibacteria bacterium]|jgi:large subunit ribosomal protein L20|nr:50S ribosomal protein L20 [Candidatus Peregrinibacteria bacterium]